MELCSLEKCTSCMACINACPFGAIDVSDSIYKVRVPSINKKECKECGICQNVCPIKTPVELNYPQKAIALYTNNEYDRVTCASGGAATTFSRFVITKGGCVFGATARGGYPHFIMVTNEEDLELLKGSKYVYCDPLQIYQKVKAELQTGRLCLFIGTPCNVGGLLSYLRKDYDNLLTIDLICHGTPPFSYLKEHINALVGDYSRVDDFTFRGSNDFYLTVYDKIGKVIYKRNQYEDEYFISFMQGFMFRSACYDCQYAQNKRASDITIGDFWNIADDALHSYKGKISVALLNTDKSLVFFQDCNNFFNYEERDVKEAIYGNEQLRHPSKRYSERQIFEKMYSQKCSIEQTFLHMGIKKLTQRNKLKRYVLFLPRVAKRILTKKIKQCQ